MSLSITDHQTIIFSMTSSYCVFIAFLFKMSTDRFIDLMIGNLGFFGIVLLLITLFAHPIPASMSGLIVSICLGLAVQVWVCVNGVKRAFRASMKKPRGPRPPNPPAGP